MFDINNFKRSVKLWIGENPMGSIDEFTDYCEEIMPKQLFASHGWLLEQTISWYGYLIKQRETNRTEYDDEAA